MTGGNAKASIDWVSDRWKRLLAWDVATAALIATVFLDASTRTVIWPIALSWMGIACLMNARRCGRRHCFFTGPFFLVMAMFALLHGMEVVSLGNHGWLWLGVVFIAGGYGLLWKLPEYLWGRYVGGKGSSP